MRIEFLGTGTSYGVPMIGCDCVVCQSEDPRDKRLRSSIWVEHQGESVVVDTGPDFRQQCLRSHLPRLDHVLITHLHADHIFGIDDVRRYNHLQQGEIPVYVPEQFLERFRATFDYALQEPTPGLVRPRLALTPVTTAPLQLKSLTVQPVRVVHSDDLIAGYVFVTDSARVAYLTDCKRVVEEDLVHVRHADVMILGAIWDGEWTHSGHLNLQEALELGGRLQPGQLYFTHITHSMGLHAAKNAELPPGRALAFDGQVIQV